MSADRLLIRGGQPWVAPHPVDLLVADGRILEALPKIEPHDAPGADVIDASGLVLLPGLVDAHCHLDKTLFGLDWTPHSAGPDLADRIQNERDRRGELGLPSATAMSALVEAMVAAGTTVARTHTDVDPDVGTTNVEAVGRIADSYSHLIDIEQVGFPQHGILTAPGTQQLLGELAADGAIAAVGGIDPAGLDGDPVKSLDVVFEIAASNGIGVDLHLHDPGSLGVWQLELIAHHARAFGLAGRVNVSHAYALGEADRPTQQRLAEQLASSGVSLVTAAVYDYPVLPLELLADHGVVVGLGNDGSRDLWGPYGDGNLLRRARLVAYRCGLRRDDDLGLALEAAANGGRAVLGRRPSRLAPGDPADIVGLAADTPAHALVAGPQPSLVVRKGRTTIDR